MPPGGDRGPVIPHAPGASQPPAGGAGSARPAPRFGRQILISFVLVAAAVILVAAVTGDRGYLDVRRQKATLSKLRAESASLREENAASLAEVRALRSDPYVIEKIAREKLGYARPGEIVFQFPPENPPVKEAPAPRP